MFGAVGTEVPEYLVQDVLESVAVEDSRLRDRHLRYPVERLRSVESAGQPLRIRPTGAERGRQDPACNLVANGYAPGNRPIETVPIGIGVRLWKRGDPKAHGIAGSDRIGAGDSAAPDAEELFHPE